MAKLNEIYKCNVCGNIVELVHASKGELVCCNEPMQLMKERTKDLGNEKHVPIVQAKKGKIIVKVGSIEHPMIKKHYIEWIQIIADGKSFKQFLKPGNKPIAEFCIKAKKITAREYCNIHGLWKN
ncbi:MAG: desulfoferrodoxin [Candidatus Nanoarchaeia archaeon]|nr:desulfoferrodoxin [Candidatus Nanoarchaeia archaeon]MDD5054133.1 desulfoferrodoxin [Candidatus Nanoarchaeia archaeon]MDD5499266.1 desulfoferrodoxin [Candidatus Nanoarchaeia archaeon]